MGLDPGSAVLGHFGQRIFAAQRIGQGPVDRLPVQAWIRERSCRLSRSESNATRRPKAFRAESVPYHFSLKAHLLGFLRFLFLKPELALCWGEPSATCHGLDLFDCGRGIEWWGDRPGIGKESTCSILRIDRLPKAFGVSGGSSKGASYRAMARWCAFWGGGDPCEAFPGGAT